MPPNPENIIYNETEKNIDVANNNHITKDVYEELRPKNEPPFLEKIRGIEKKMGFITPLKWTSIIVLSLSHLVLATCIVYDVYAGLHPKWQTALFVVVYGYAGGFGVTAGVHRYWSHHSYKAATPFRWLLGLLFVIAGQNKMYHWIRDHRVHHKFSETSADPHDVTRGLFFSHVGWLMMLKHPDVIREGRKVDLTDLRNDPVIQFHNKYFLSLKLLFCFVVPISLPVLLWGESWGQATIAQLCAMHVSLHSVWSVNSFAHSSGNRPYDPRIGPSENKLVSLMAIGEGWHNYHHTFPWDYKASELPYAINLTTLLLDCFAWLGLVWHRRTASPELIQATVKRNQES